MDAKLIREKLDEAEGSVEEAARIRRCAGGVRSADGGPYVAIESVACRVDLYGDEALCLAEWLDACAVDFETRGAAAAEWIASLKPMYAEGARLGQRVVH